MNAPRAPRLRTIRALVLLLASLAGRTVLAASEIPAARVLGRAAPAVVSAEPRSIAVTFSGPGRIFRFEKLPPRAPRLVIFDGAEGYELWTDAAGRLTLSGPARPGSHRIDVLPPDQTRLLTYLPPAAYARSRDRVWGTLVLLLAGSAALWIFRAKLPADEEAPGAVRRAAGPRRWMPVIASLLLAVTAGSYAKRVWTSPALPFPRKVKRDMELFRHSQFILGWKQPGLRIMNDQRIYAFAGWLQAHGTRPDLANPEHPPLGKYLLGAAERIAHTPVAATFAAGLAALAGLALLGRRILESWTLAFVATSITAAGALLASYTINTYLEIFVLALAAWSLLAAARAAEKPLSPARVVLLDAILGAGMALKWSFAVFGLAVVVTLVRSRRLRSAAAFAAGAPLAFAVYGLAYARSFTQGLSPTAFLVFQRGIARRWTLVNASAKPSTWGLWRILFTGIPDYSPHRVPEWSLLWPAAAVLGIAGAILAFRRRDPAGTACGIWFLGQMLFFTAAPSWERYLVPVLPFAVILAVSAIARLPVFRRSIAVAEAI